MQTPLLQARGVVRRLPGGAAWLLEDISLSLAAGDRVTLSGPSGSGKTLLVRALALLDPIDAGTIEWRGGAISAADVPSYRSQVIYLHQRPVLMEGNVEANLRLPFGLAVHRGRHYDPTRIAGYLADLGREPTLLSRQPAELSGGEAQITALLRAIQLDPVVLLLDEPTASLDPESVRHVERLVERWFAEGAGARAFLWISHDPAQVERLRGRRLVLRAGRLQEES